VGIHEGQLNLMLRFLPFIIAGVGGTLLVVNRLLTPQLTESQARSDVVGALLVAMLVLTGLLWQQVQPKLPDRVILEGEEGFELEESLPEDLRVELAWLSHLLLTNTATRSIVVYYRDRVLMRRGVLGSESQVTPGAILQRVLEKQKPVYLVDVKTYPGKVEFNYLPPNIQGIICQPLGGEGVLILGANAPRSYTKQDEVWIAGMAEKLSHTLSIHQLTVES
jgi:hypothetical protein